MLEILWQIRHIFLSLSCLRGNCVKFPISFKLITVLRDGVCELSSLCLTEARRLRVDQGTVPNWGPLSLGVENTKNGKALHLEVSSERIEESLSPPISAISHSDQ